VVSQQVRDAIPVGLHCNPKRCPYCEEDSLCLVMGEEIKPEYKICGINLTLDKNVKVWYNKVQMGNGSSL
jgi:hypothetical protein